MNEIEYFIFIPVKNFIAAIAKAARCLLPLLLFTAIAEQILFFYAGYPVGLLFGMVSDQLLHIFIAMVSILCFWSHHVLLAGRGRGITRFLCAFALIMSGIMLACSIYTLCTNELLLIKQGQTPIIISTILFASVLINLSNMAAAPLSRRFLLGFFLFFQLAASITTILPELCRLCLLFKILLTCTGFPLLRQLQQTAPRIISMPPRN